MHCFSHLWKYVKMTYQCQLSYGLLSSKDFTRSDSFLIWCFCLEIAELFCYFEYRIDIVAKHCRFLVPGNTQKILTEIWNHFWLKNDDEKWSRKNYFEIPPWPSEIPANLPGQFSLSGQIFLHWAAATLKAIVEFWNNFF